jgi:hypothetical protein
VTTTAVPDTTPPTVVSTSPVNNDGGVKAYALITATFSEALNASSVSATSFTLDHGATGAVTVSPSGTFATFTPTSYLAYSTTYTATLTTGVKDAAGNALASNYTWSFTTQEPPINDTGITYSQCYQAASDVLGSCGDAGAIALNPEQDGMVGRDANAATNANNDGKLGFSFTAVTGGCVQDNVTGLMWEVKTTDGGLRDWTKTYTNLGDNSAADASTFVTAVNATNLCGHWNWRLPTADELQSSVDYSVKSPGPTIDANWFPNTQRGGYWSSLPYVVDPTRAWGVSFFRGDVGDAPRTNSSYVRLVRADQWLVIIGF